MQRQHFEEMYGLEDSYWWFVGRRRMVRNLIRRYAPRRESLRVLDAGCGTGGTLAALEGVGEIWGCDISGEALEMCRLRGFDRLKQSPIERLDFEDESFDVVVSCDVLEHVEDDDAGMREIARVLRPGGICVLTVPAHQWLWSEHDEALRHLRRYQHRRLRKVVEGAGLRVEKLTEAVALALPAIVLYRALRRLTRGSSDEPATSLVRLPGPLNRLLIGLLDVENAVIGCCRLPLGASLMAVARKPAEGDKGAG